MDSPQFRNLRRSPDGLTGLLSEQPVLDNEHGDMSRALRHEDMRTSVMNPPAEAPYDPGPRHLRGSAGAGQLAMGFGPAGQLFAGYDKSGGRVGGGPLVVTSPEETLPLFDQQKTAGLSSYSGGLSAELHPNVHSHDALFSIGGQHNVGTADMDDLLDNMGVPADSRRTKVRDGIAVRRLWRDESQVKTIGPDAPILRAQPGLGLPMGAEQPPGTAPVGAAQTMESLRHVDEFGAGGHRGMAGASVTDAATADPIEDGDAMPWLVQMQDDGRGRMNPATGKYEQGGMLVQVDGNHRAAASRLRGDGSFQGRVLPLRTSYDAHDLGRIYKRDEVGEQVHTGNVDRVSQDTVINARDEGVLSDETMASALRHPDLARPERLRW